MKKLLFFAKLILMCLVCVCQEKNTSATYDNISVQSFKDSTEFYTFPDSNGVRRIYHENGNVYREGVFKKVRRQLFLSINVYHGLWNIYYASGSMESRGKYLYGKKDSIWEYFTEDKRLLRIELYNRGKLIDKRIYIDDEFPLDSIKNIKGVWIAD